MKYFSHVLLVYIFILYSVILTSSAVIASKSSEEQIKFKNLKSVTLKKYIEESNMNKIQEHLNHILVERVADTPSHTQVREYIVSQFNTDLYWNVEYDSFKDNTPFGEKTFTNIIITSNFKNDNNNDDDNDNDNEVDSNKPIPLPKTLILSAHYDSKYFEEFKFMGATDSAVPCAMLIDIAKSLESEIIKSKKRIMIIFFDGEEAFKDWTSTDSLYGSRHLANLLSNKKVDSSGTLVDYPNKKAISKKRKDSFYGSVDSLILLDLIGTSNPKFYMFNQKTEPLFKKLSDIEDNLKLKRFISPKPTKYFINQYLNGEIQDDHIPFLNYVPTLHIIPYPFPGVWHTVKDDATCLDKNTIEDLTKIFKVFVGSYL